MGFGQALKAANMNFGTVEGPGFEACYITKSSFRDANSPFLIVGAQAGEYEFYHDDVEFVKPIASGGSWIKWFMKFKDGKSCVVTSAVKDPTQKGSGVSMAPFERFFGDLVLAGEESVQTAGSVKPKKTPVKDPKKCPKCGSPITDDMLFCGECGAKLK